MAELVLLTAKLRRPRVTRNLVVRPRLLTMLDEGLAGPMSVVVAPAGFGKTSLVSSWLEELKAGFRPGLPLVPAVWLTLDEGDSDPNMFLQYFIGALRTIFPDAGAKSLALLTAQQPPSLDHVATTLSNEIEWLPSSFIVVLDEVENLRGRAVLDFLTTWTRHWPRPLHLILISRQDPALPLPKMRARGKVIEVRGRDLRFTDDETAEFLERTWGGPLDPAVMDTIQHSLEGWIAGLRMVALSVEAKDNPEALSRMLLEENHMVAGYILDEVLRQQTPDVQRFLLRLSVTEQFNESLSQALVCDVDPDCDVRALLDFLERNELFVSRLDARHEWYRMHRLFQDHLLRRLVQQDGEEAVADLRRRAASWLAGHGLIDRALNHALDANDPALAAEFMIQGYRDVLNRTNWSMLERWLALLPGDIIESSPELLLMRAWSHGLRWELGTALLVAEQAEALLAAEDTGDGPPAAEETARAALLRGQIVTLKAQNEYFRNQHERAVAYCREALALLPLEWDYVRRAAVVFLGPALYASGQGAEAERFVTAAYSAEIDKSSAFALRLLLVQALNALQAGRLETVQQIAEVKLRGADKHQDSLGQGWAHYLLGYVAYQYNDLQQAELHYSAAAELRYTTQLLVSRSGLTGLASIYQVQGKTEQARRIVAELSQLDLELSGQETILTVAARARLALMQGDLAAADTWSQGIPLPPADQPLMPWIEEPLLTRINVLIACNRPGDVALALEALDVMEEIAVRTHSVRSLVAIRALRAMGQLAQGNAVSARKSLIEAVELARRTGQRRLFIDLGPNMTKLLNQIAAHHTVSETVRGLLAAIAEADQTRPSAPVGEAARNGDIVLSDDLTPRELQILSLMVEPMSLAEISKQLHIEPSTAKRHTINLYHKLGVHSRWEAVAAAVELGILSPY